MAFWVDTTYPGFPVNGISNSLGAMSSDGTVMVSSNLEPESTDGYIWVSGDSGATWTEKTAPGLHGWAGFAASSSGAKLYAQVYNGYIWSSADSGGTWTEQAGSGIKNWTDICCSSDGATVYAVESNGLCYKSTNSGVTWAATDSTAASCRSVACSADGSIILAGGSLTGDLYLSDDGGATWTTPLTGSDFISVAMDDAGLNMVAVEVVGDVFVSNNSGGTWTNATNNPNANQYNSFVSSDGAVMITNYSGATYFSYDSGSTWAYDSDGTPYFIAANKADGETILGDADTWWTYAGLLPSTPMLSITSITPNTGSTAGGTPVTIVGSGFDPAATAAIDGNDLTDVTVVDSTTMTGITPAGTAGEVDVTVTNP